MLGRQASNPYVNWTCLRQAGYVECYAAYNVDRSRQQEHGAN